MYTVISNGTETKVESRIEALDHAEAHFYANHKHFRGFDVIDGEENITDEIITELGELIDLGV